MSDGFDDVLAGVWRKNRPVAVARARRVAGLEGDDASLRDDAHKLAGALGMYGLDGAGAIAQRIDGLITDGGLATPDGRAEVASAGAELLAALESTT